MDSTRSNRCFAASPMENSLSAPPGGSSAVFDTAASASKSGPIIRGAVALGMLEADPSKDSPPIENLCPTLRSKWQRS